MSARSLGMFTLLTTLYTGCADKPQEATIIAQPQTIPYVASAPVAAQPDASLEERTQAIPGVKILKVFAVSEYKGKIDDTPKYARLGENVTMHAVIQALTPQGTFYFTQAPKLTVKGRKITPSQIKAWPYSTTPSLEWLKLEVDPRIPLYNNNDEDGRCRIQEPNCNRVSYRETEWQTGWSVAADVHPTTQQDQFNELQSGLGVMRYVLQIPYGENVFRTSSSEAMKSIKGSNEVLRVSFAHNQGLWTDHAFAFFNTPYMWASTTPIVEAQIAADCADLPVFARRRDGHKQSYTWSVGLRDQSITKPITVVTTNLGKNLDESAPNNKFRIINFDANDPNAVHPGDLLSWGTANRSKVGHAAILYKDKGDGVLSVDDLAIDDFPHSGNQFYRGPMVRPIAEILKDMGQDRLPVHVVRWRKE